MTKPLLLAAMLLAISAGASAGNRLTDNGAAGVLADEIQQNRDKSPFGPTAKAADIARCSDDVRRHLTEGFGPPAYDCMADYANAKFTGRYGAAVLPSREDYARYQDAVIAAEKLANTYSGAAQRATWAVQMAKLDATRPQLDTPQSIQLPAAAKALKAEAARIRNTNPFLVANGQAPRTPPAGATLSYAEQMRARTEAKYASGNMAAAAAPMDLADIPPLEPTPFNAAAVLRAGQAQDVATIEVGDAAAPVTIQLVIDPALSGYSRTALETALAQLDQGKARLRIIPVSLMPKGADTAKVAGLLSAADPVAALRAAARGELVPGTDADVVKVQRNSAVLFGASLTGVPYSITDDGKSRRWKLGN